MSSGKVIIVTGASRGLGRAICEHLCSSAGPFCSVRAVVGTARSTEPLAALAAQFPSVFTYSAGDINDEAFIDALVSETVKKYGRIDGIVHNAGVLGPLKSISTAPVSEWQDTINTNLIAPFVLSQKALPYLREANGRLIFISSGASKGPCAAWSAYCVSKAALNMAAACFAAEEPSITSVSVRPGVINTDMQGRIRAEGRGEMTDTHYAKFVGMKESGQLLEPEVPGKVIARMAIEIPSEFSGQYVDWQDESFASYLN
ncbi:putative short-chain dehydrogenase/reductase [Ramicandelaber brevisporus]|nr:putative short-chain dehydrogenase/reductase [Ramicandelaber brevisporus]KAI8870998.1 putative short-chain dehydrogenase/reductase [Ramicandelaber brevisporus]